MSDTVTRTRKVLRRLPALLLVMVLTLGLLALAGGGAEAAADSVRRWAYGHGLDLTEPAASLEYTVGETVLALPESLELTVEGGILDADLSETGDLCYLQEDGDYKTILTVADETGEAFYRWYSASRWLTACAMGDGMTAVAGIAESGETELLLLETDQEEPAACVNLGSQTVYDLCFFEDSLCIVSDTAVSVLREGQRTEVPHTWPLAYAFGDGFAAVLLEGELRVVDENGQTRSIAADNVTDLTAAGKYVAFVQNGEAVVYTAQLRELSRQAWDGEPLTLRTDGALERF